MKKKIFIISFMIIASARLLFAVPAVNTSKGIELQGGYYDFFSLSITPLDASSQQYTSGMPFDLERKDIDPVSSPDGSGIKIATWTLLSSEHKFQISVVPEPLKFRDVISADDTTHEDPGELGYQLTFNYALRYYYGGQSHKLTNTEFVVNSDGTITGTTNPLLGGGVAIDLDTYVGVDSGEIYFKLTKDGADLVHHRTRQSGQISPEIPDGYYGCKVKVRLTVLV